MQIAEWAHGDATATVAWGTTQSWMHSRPGKRTATNLEQHTEVKAPSDWRAAGWGDARIAAAADRFTRAPPISDGGGDAGRHARGLQVVG